MRGGAEARRRRGEAARRRANGRGGIEIGKAHAIGGKSVEIGCYQVGGSEGAKISVPLIIRQYQDDIGWRTAKTQGTRQQEEGNPHESVKGTSSTWLLSFRHVIYLSARGVTFSDCAPSHLSRCKPISSQPEKTDDLLISFVTDATVTPKAIYRQSIACIASSVY